MHFDILRPWAAIITAFAITILPSCKNRSQEQAFLSSLDKTITQSAQSSLYKMQGEIALLVEKSYEPCSREKAQLWLPVAKTVERLTMDLSAYILNIRQDTKMSNKKPSLLYDSLNHRIKLYRDSAYASNEFIEHDFAERFDGLDSSHTKQSDLAAQLQLLKTATRAQLPLLLAEIRHSIIQTGMIMVSFCRENASCSLDRFDMFSVIIGQNSNVLLPGQTFEVTAGVGAFSTAASPKITINGKTCQVHEDGVARYSLPASQVAGKHMVPVKIEYIDANGIQRSFSKNIVYRVFDEKRGN